MNISVSVTQNTGYHKTKPISSKKSALQLCQDFRWKISGRQAVV